MYEKIFEFRELISKIRILKNLFLVNYYNVVQKYLENSSF